MQDVYKNFEEYKLEKRFKVMTVFDDAIADMISQKKHSQIVTDLFVRGTK